MSNTAVATQTIAPNVIRYGRAIGRCKTCKTVNVWESETTTFAPGAVICQCGAWCKVEGVIGSHSTKECNDRCMGAVGPSCDCSCGGANHGGRHA